MYACSPKWSNYWINLGDLEKILGKLAEAFAEAPPMLRGVNYGLHLTGGEPFLNFRLLLKAAEVAERLGFSYVFAETNCFWCVNDGEAEGRLVSLKEAGLDGLLVSANPFVVECVPFERILRGVRLAQRVFGSDNVMVYHPVFLRQFSMLEVKNTMKFEEYLKSICRLDPEGLREGFSPSVMLPMGRLPYRLGHLYRRYPASRFFQESCIDELTRPWHIHVDCYCNYVPGYCAGISLGDARALENILDGVELDDRPILKALASCIRELYEYAVKEHGYRELEEGYVSKCHLCLDIRRHIAMETDEYKELQPREFYQRL